MWTFPYLLLTLLLVARLTVQYQDELGSSSHIVERGHVGEPLTPEDFHNAEHLQDPTPPENPEEAMENSDLFEGDIVLPDELDQYLRNGQLNPDDFERNAIVQEKAKWPGGVIPYTISSQFSKVERSVIARAFLEYHRKTCITLRPRTTETDYIKIQKGGGCSSHVGRTGGGQPVTLGQGCVYTGIVVHELMHAAGFWHEQSRWDRDDHVTINYNNILPGLEFNFQKYKWTQAQNLSVTYDTSSVLHYGRYAFARDKRYPTITPKNPNAQMGQRDGFSPKDIKKINILYKCGQHDGAGPMNVDGSGTTTEATTPPVATESPPMTGCEDRAEDCASRAQDGDCESSSQYMKANCARTCRVCEIDPVPDNANDGNQLK